jgi:hypothetical protein
LRLGSVKLRFIGSTPISGIESTEKLRAHGIKVNTNKLHMNPQYLMGMYHLKLPQIFSNYIPHVGKLQRKMHSSCGNFSYWKQPSNFSSK